MEKLTISINELAQRLGISRTSAYWLSRSPGFPTIRIGRRRLIDVKKLEVWLASQSGAEDQQEEK